MAVGAGYRLSLEPGKYNRAKGKGLRILPHTRRPPLGFLFSLKLAICLIV